MQNLLFPVCFCFTLIRRVTCSGFFRQRSAWQTNAGILRQHWASSMPVAILHQAPPFSMGSKPRNLAPAIVTQESKHDTPYGWDEYDKAQRREWDPIFHKFDIPDNWIQWEPGNFSTTTLEPIDYSQFYPKWFPPPPESGRKDGKQDSRGLEYSAGPKWDPNGMLYKLGYGKAGSGLPDSPDWVLLRKQVRMQVDEWRRQMAVPWEDNIANPDTWNNSQKLWEHATFWMQGLMMPIEFQNWTRAHERCLMHSSEANKTSLAFRLLGESDLTARGIRGEEKESELTAHISALWAAASAAWDAASTFIPRSRGGATTRAKDTTPEAKGAIAEAARMTWNAAEASRNSSHNTMPRKREYEWRLTSLKFQYLEELVNNCSKYPSEMFIDGEDYSWPWYWPPGGTEEDFLREGETPTFEKTHGVSLMFGLGTLPPEMQEAWEAYNDYDTYEKWMKKSNGNAFWRKYEKAAYDEARDGVTTTTTWRPKRLKIRGQDEWGGITSDEYNEGKTFGEENQGPSLLEDISDDLSLQLIRIAGSALIGVFAGSGAILLMLDFRRRRKMSHSSLPKGQSS